MSTDEILWLPLAEIVKREKNPDGSVTVVGAVSNPKKDLDRQIVDTAFLKRALPDWFTKRANIREMHMPSAVGKGKELSEGADGMYTLTSKVVDPMAAKKVEEGVYSAYSVGIKNARVVRDAEAEGGRIVDGTIVEVSLVDYPASDVGKLVIAKAATPDEDTGAVALTEDEAKAVEEGLVAKEAKGDVEKAADGTHSHEHAHASAMGGSYSHEHDHEHESDADHESETAHAHEHVGRKVAKAAGLAPDDLRAAVLARNPAVTEADLSALLEAYAAICSPNQEAGGIDSEHSEAAEGASADADAGASASAASRGQSQKTDDDDDARTRASKLTEEQLAGNVKSALPDALKAADIRAILADEAKAAVADLVKAAVQDGVKAVEDRIAKLEKSPAPIGPVVGATAVVAERLSTLDRAFPVTPDASARKAADPLRARLETLASNANVDAETRAAAREALASMAS